MSHLNFSILAFSTNLGPSKIDLSSNTAWLQASRFQKLLMNFYPLTMLNDTFSVIFKQRARYTKSIKTIFISYQFK